MKKSKLLNIDGDELEINWINKEYTKKQELKESKRIKGMLLRAKFMVKFWNDEIKYLKTFLKKQ